MVDRDQSTTSRDKSASGNLNTLYHIGRDLWRENVTFTKSRNADGGDRLIGGAFSRGI